MGARPEWGTVALEVDVARTVHALRVVAADAAAEVDRWPAVGVNANPVARGELTAIAEELPRVADALESARDERTLIGAAPILISAWHTVEGYRAWVG
jgi:hypothetical protein